MKVKKEESEFKPIDVTFHIKIESLEELESIKEFANHPSGQGSIFFHDKLQLNVVGKLLNDLCTGIVKDYYNEED